MEVDGSDDDDVSFQLGNCQVQNVNFQVQNVADLLKYSTDFNFEAPLLHLLFQNLRQPSLDVNKSYVGWRDRIDQKMSRGYSGIS